MATYPIPQDEAERLNLLHALNILDTRQKRLLIA